VLALSISEVRACLGKSLHVVLLRNQLKAILQKESFFQKLSKPFASKLLDAFMICACEKGKTVVDPYKKQKNTVFFVLEGAVEVNFPKFIPTKSQKLLSSIKDIRNKENVDTKQLFGLESLKRAAIGDKADEYFEFSLQFLERGKVARTTLTEV
jgi:hypothetical protein